jgi:hypothetical protein
MKTERLIIHITEFEKQLIEALIQEHYNETGITMSKSAFCRAALYPLFKEAQDTLVKEEH